jgi:hypothetical protein
MTGRRESGFERHLLDCEALIGGAGPGKLQASAAARARICARTCARTRAHTCTDAGPCARPRAYAPWPMRTCRHARTELHVRREAFGKQQRGPRKTLLGADRPLLLQTVRTPLRTPAQLRKTYCEVEGPWPKRSQTSYMGYSILPRK